MNRASRVVAQFSDDFAPVCHSTSCPNCGSDEVCRGRVIGKLDLGGGYGFRPDQIGRLGALFRSDVPLGQRWLGCTHCGMIWTFVDATRLAQRTGSEQAKVNASQSEATGKPVRGALIWHQGLFVPFSIRRRLRMRRLLFRSTILVILIVVPFVAYTVMVRQGVPFWIYMLCTNLVILFMLLWSREIVAARFLRRKLIRHNFYVCPRCEYLLSPTAGRSYCSECGLKYDSAELEKVWMEHWRA
jgi:hypothetical protein